jgi:hypothetical protein
VKRCSSEARLDADGTAKPLTEIVAVVPKDTADNWGRVNTGNATHLVARPCADKPRKEAAPEGDNMPIPDGVILRNGTGVLCDMRTGPCACGAWHTENEWGLRHVENGLTRPDSARQAKEDPPEAWMGIGEDGSVGFDLRHKGKSLGAVTFASDGEVEIVIAKRAAPRPDSAPPAVDWKERHAVAVKDRNMYCRRWVETERQVTAFASVLENIAASSKDDETRTLASAVLNEPEYRTDEQKAALTRTETALPEGTKR